MIRLLVEAAALRPHSELLVIGDEYTYLTRVRRVVCGDLVEVFDGAGQRATATVVAIDGTRARLTIVEVIADAPTGPHLTALIPLIKGERMEQCVTQLVEVGASPPSFSLRISTLGGLTSSVTSARYILGVSKVMISPPISPAMAAATISLRLSLRIRSSV